MPVEGEHVKFACEILGEAGDILGLFEQNGAIEQFAVFFAKTPNRSEGEVGVDVDSLQRWMLLAAVNISAGDTGADSVIGKRALVGQGRQVRVLDDGVDVIRRIGARFEPVEALADAPAVIATLDDQVHFLPLVLADISRPELSGFAIPTHAPDVAQTVGPNLA